VFLALSSVRPADSAAQGRLPFGPSAGACAAAFLARSSLRYSRLRHRRQAGELDTAVQCSSLRSRLADARSFGWTLCMIQWVTLKRPTQSSVSSPDTHTV
jgi:hypothetical protein